MDLRTRIRKVKAKLLKDVLETEDAGQQHWQSMCEHYCRQVKDLEMHADLLKTSQRHCTTPEAGDPEALAGRLNAVVKEHLGLEEMVRRGFIFTAR
jgi:hypothetical protein